MSERAAAQGSSAVATNSNHSVRTLVLQGVPPEIANGVVTLTYNEFIKYFVKVYVEKSKENPELRECRQEVILHNQHIEETLKRIDQLRAASRVLISQQAQLSRGCNRSIQINTRTVGVNVRILEDFEATEISKNDSVAEDPDIKVIIPKARDIGIQTTLTVADIEKAEKVLWTPTSHMETQTMPVTFISDEDTARTKHEGHNPLKREFSNEDDFEKKVYTDAPFRRMLDDGPCKTLANEDRVILKAIHINGPRDKPFCEGEPPHKIVHINGPPPHRIVHEGEPPDKIIRVKGPHGVIPQDKPTRRIVRVLRKIIRNGKVIRIFDHQNNDHEGGSLPNGTDSPPRKMMRIDGLPPTPLPVSCSSEVTTPMDTSSQITASNSDLPEIKSSTCYSSPVTIPSNSSSVPAVVISSNSPPQTTISTDDPHEVVLPSNDACEVTNQSSDLLPGTVLSSGPSQVASQDICPRVAVRSKGPPQVAIKSGETRRVAIRSMGPPQAAARSDSPSSTAVCDSEPPKKTDDNDSRPLETVDSDAPQKDKADSTSVTMDNSKDPLPSTLDITVISSTVISGKKSPGVEVKVEIEDNDPPSESVNGNDPAQESSSGNKKESSQATNKKKTVKSKKKSTDAATSKGKSVEVVDLVSDDDDDSSPPSAKPAAAPKTIIIPIGTAPTTTTSSSNIPSVSILPTLPSVVQIRSTSATSASPGNLRMIHPIATQQFFNRSVAPRGGISRPIVPSGSSRLTTYLVPLSSAALFNQMNSPRTLFRSPTPNGVQNVVTLTPIRPSTRPSGPKGGSTK